MITYMGMSDKLPNLSYYDSTGQEYTFSKPYSDETAQLIDNEVKTMIAEQYARAKQILTEHTAGHNKLAEILLEREIIYSDDLEHIFGKRKWVSRSQEILDSKIELTDEVTPSRPINAGNSTITDYKSKDTNEPDQDEERLNKENRETTIETDK